MKFYNMTFLIFAAGTLFILSFTQSQPAEQTSSQELTGYPVQDIEIEVKFHMVESGGKQSLRNSEEAKKILGEANRIWRQAGIRFSLYLVSSTRLDSEIIADAVGGNPAGIVLAEGFDPDRINVFFVPEMEGMNGISFPSYRSVMISDFTTVHDYRTLAHELGHMLRLRHMPYPERLMSIGSNGEALDIGEAEFARYNARRMFIKPSG